MDISAEELKLLEIFFPIDVRKRLDVEQNNRRFVHYTSAEAAVGIIRNREIWMRKSSVMNDFMEFEYGMECLRSAYASGTGELFRARLDEMFPGFTTDLEKRFDSWIPMFRTDTYLTCMSEHLESEDRIGRLSMWRAYGGTTGVAFVMKNTPFMAVSDTLKAYSSAVQYLDRERFAAELGKISDSLAANVALVQEAGFEHVMGLVFIMMRFAALCTKHPGFLEEKEWRIIYTPSFERSSTISESIETIRGIPQMVCKIPMKNSPSEGLHEADIPSLLDHLIIGPTEHPRATHEAFVALLDEAGVEDAQRKVWVSDIPVRQS